MTEAASARCVSSTRAHAPWRRAIWNGCAISRRSRCASSMAAAHGRSRRCATRRQGESAQAGSAHSFGDELLEAERIALARGLARLDARKAAGLDEPLAPGRQLPSPLHGDARIPPHRLVLDIHDLVVRVEQLD